MDPMNGIVLAAADGHGIDYWQVVTGGGPIVVGVLLLLLASSVASWAIIVRKWWDVRAATGQSARFLELFWKSKQLDQVYKESNDLELSPVCQVFRAGYVELSKVTHGGEGSIHELGGMENVERALKRSTNAELAQLEEGAFHDITVAGNASLTTVAQPISEALIATAVGLFAAIPAVVAYNYFASRIRALENEMSNFGADFLNIVKRHYLKGA